MSSSIEEHFDPPSWATREEIIKAARHYINYWRIEAKHRNEQWLSALDENKQLRQLYEHYKSKWDDHNKELFNKIIDDFEKYSEKYQPAKTWRKKRKNGGKP